MTSTGVKKRNSQFFATVLIQDEGEPEQDVADAGRSDAHLPIMSAPQSDDTSPAIMGFLHTGIAPAQIHPHPLADRTRDKEKGRMEGSGYVSLYSNSLPGYVPYRSSPLSTEITQFQPQPQEGRARDKGKGRMDDVPPQSDSLLDAPQAREPTSLGRFLVLPCGEYQTVRYLVHLPWPSPDDPIVQREILHLCRLKKNIVQVEVMLRTAHLSVQDQKPAILHALGGIDGALNENPYEGTWRKYRHHIKLIDLLSDPGAIGGNLTALAILIPAGFSWIEGHETSLATGDSMQATVAGVMERVPELRQLSLELIPYGVWLMGESEGPPPSLLKGVEVF
ncbi:hypothetical protein VE01_04164 [Pseudogymnoascus verrucosus]|uniref:Uncharacterized protein n=1 Tax=Pseudogymnoascus verrucosus TaxID=342668 RepID=A0A1B8GLS4_9PEZI|nr:uncharacterized protein VE01_04164 [Pseudogymnoascus verrucosus]OBT96777.1 hypothetical protein VE01_04164 [Pseudogymnoascus verrucosus]